MGEERTDESDKDVVSETQPIGGKFALDTNGDGSISPLDVLTIVNHLNRKVGGPVEDGAENDNQNNDFLDANADRSVSPLDVLMLINFLNLRSNAGEGEAADLTAVSESLNENLGIDILPANEVLRSKKANTTKR